MRSVWYVSLRERRSGKKRGREREKRGIGWIKGPCMQKKKAHIETETDKVTQSRVALTERESESVLVITVFTFPLSSLIPLY